MLGFLCARRKTWIASSLFSSSFTHGLSAIHHTRIPQTPATNFSSSLSGHRRRHHHTTACQLGGGAGAAASIWHAILPSSGPWRRRRPAIHYELKGEGSWNAAVDARPARWLHRPDSAWLLFGVCNCLAPIEWDSPINPTNATDGDWNKTKVDETEAREAKGSVTSEEKIETSPAYRVTGVLADGRCLFRAIAHVACLRNGDEAPDENRQRELADELRAQVVNELLKRREETEWFIEGDFDTYVNRIQQPYVWGGEPELLMASHVKKTPISVFMVDRSSGGLVNIAKYGEEYEKEEEKPINVLFHGYGHYDILESFTEQCLQK